MKKGNLLLEGKTKKIWEVSGKSDLVIVEHKDTIIAFDDPKFTKQFKTKAQYSTITTSRIFEFLRQAKIRVAFQEQISLTEFVAQKCEMIPLEVVARRFAVGSYLKRHPELIRAGNELPFRFHRLVTELFLKTTNGMLVNKDKEVIVGELDPKKGEEDPFIINPHDDEWKLFHSKKPRWELKADLKQELLCEDVLPDKEMVKYMQEITRDTFLLLEGGWNTLGFRLIDMKIEFGIRSDGELVIADVIDNDSWRLSDVDWQELSKEAFRQGDELNEVEKKYGIVASLVQGFKLSKQCLVLWRGSDKDEFPDTVSLLEIIESNLCEEKITLSGHKSPRQCLDKLEEIVGKYPDGGVILVKVGMSNGLAPILATRTTWPVIAVPATAKSFPQDIWSSLRMPSNVPLSIVISEANAIDYALNILSQKNPVLYMHRQRGLMALDS